MTDFLKSLGEVVQEQRNHCKHKQQGLAELVGVHRSMISRLEAGNANSLALLPRVADALGLYAWELVAMAEKKQGHDIAEDVLVRTEVKDGN